MNRLVRPLCSRVWYANAPTLLHRLYNRYESHLRDVVKGGLTGCEYWLTKGDHAAAVTALNTALGTGPRAAGISGWRNIMQAINSSKALAKNPAILRFSKRRI